MAQKLSNEDLENVAGGGCSGPGKCSACEKDLKNCHYYTCKYSINPNNRKNVQSYKICDACYEQYKNDNRYYDWEAHLD